MRLGADPAAGVLQAVRAAHRTDIAVGTMDLSNTVAVSLVGGGPVKALTVDDPYSIGQSLAAVIGYGLIDKAVPAYIEVPAIPITKGQHPSGLCRQLSHGAAAGSQQGPWESRPRFAA